MKEQQRYYDEEQKIKIVEVAIKELEGKRYTYLMTDDYLALAKELLQFGFNDGFVEQPFILNPHLSTSVREAMEEAGATYSVTFSRNVYIMNRYLPGARHPQPRPLPLPHQHLAAAPALCGGHGKCPATGGIPFGLPASH